jgi:hypothetical protein
MPIITISERPGWCTLSTKEVVVAMRWTTNRLVGPIVVTVILASASAVWAGYATPLPAAPVASAATHDQIIYLVVGAVHTDLTIPRAAFADAPPRLKAAVDQMSAGSWVTIGFGPYFFGRDKLLSTGKRAADFVWCLVKPEETSRLRLAARSGPGPAPHQEDYVGLVALHLSDASLKLAMARIDRTFTAGPDGGPVVTYRPPSDPNVEIFLSEERYSLRHECNQWVADVLRSGGLRVRRGPDLVSAGLALSLPRHSPDDQSPPPAPASTPGALPE